MIDDLQIPLQAQAALAGPVKRPGPVNDAAAAAKAAEEFEAVFIAQFLGSMFQGIKAEAPFGGGPGEEIFRSLMLEEYGKTIARQGGFGLADAVKRELLTLQEAPR